MRARNIAAVLAGAALNLVAAGAAQAAAGPANGLYLATLYFSGSLSKDVYLFRDGQVAHGPIGPIENFDFARFRKAAPRAVGSFALNGNRLVVIWADGSRKEGAFERQAGDPCFYWDTWSFCPVTPFPPGARLDGTFSGGGGSTISLTGTPLVQDMTLTLHQNGRFEYSGLSAIIPTAPNPDTPIPDPRPDIPGRLPSASATEEQTGTYEIDGTALTLHPAGKPARTALVFPYNDDRSPLQPHWLYFNGVMLTRIK